MAGALKSTCEGATLILTLSNPAFKNALGPEIYTAGIEALSAAETNPDIRSIVIVGDGTVFSVGGDLHRLQENLKQLPEVQAQSIDGFHSWIECIRTYPKPVIAAVEGAAAGAGFALALACDFCVAADNAVFRMAYSAVGLSPDGGATWALARALPRPLISEILMGGQRISAKRLYDFGLINTLSHAGTALADAHKLADQLNRLAPNVLASIKELITEAATQTFSQHLSSERDHFVRNLHHSNGAEGIASFLEKRIPHYK